MLSRIPVLHVTVKCTLLVTCIVMWVINIGLTLESASAPRFVKPTLMYAASAHPDVVSISLSTTNDAVKYLYVAGWFGRFANNLVMLVHSLVISRRLGRVLLIPDKTYQGVELAEIFDLTYLTDMGYAFEIRSGLSKHKYRGRDRATDIRDLDEFVSLYQESNSSLLLLHSYTAYYKCLTIEEQRVVWGGLRPSTRYGEKILQLRQKYGLTKGKYVGVHLRKLESECLRHAKSHFQSDFQQSLTSMCNISLSMVRDITEKHLQNSTDMKVFVASDGQDRVRDSQFRDTGAVFIEQVDAHGYFLPALDYLMLLDSFSMIGNPMSSFSSTVAIIRVGRGRANRDILNWPIVNEGIDESNFWTCHRFMFWCSKPKHPIC